MQYVEKFRVFFYRSRDHGRDIMTSYLGSLVHKSLKMTKIMPNSLKLLDYYILSNAPPKKRQQALNVDSIVHTCSVSARKFYLRAKVAPEDLFQGPIYQDSRQMKCLVARYQNEGAIWRALACQENKTKAYMMQSMTKSLQCILGGFQHSQPSGSFPM